MVNASLVFKKIIQKIIFEGYKCYWNICIWKMYVDKYIYIYIYIYYFFILFIFLYIYNFLFYLLFFIILYTFSDLFDYNIFG